ncbi:hypothetical protein [Streptomyces showdoensis]|uniref:Lipoprotein n=1 Tax=Streptomyces showdoensis TaxID=68268 RepID=A0A2P2GMF2_STREW|nr:hypothetical protein [Streptomyces showdoensis]KKZ71995.1 hypothetical protein VO63_20660 [Streptomyces showdoensis]
MSARTGRPGVLTAAATALLLATGCSTMNDSAADLPYEPQAKKVAEAKDLVRARSSEIFDAAGLKQAGNGAPDASPCDGVEDGYRVRHFWSMYGTADALKQAMDRLHEGLPAKGWKVLRFEPAKSEAKQLQLDVEHERDHHTATIELLLPSTYKDASKWEKQQKDSLSVSVTSPCWTDPAYQVGD